MRRVGLRLIAIALLVGLLPLSASGCNIACACASTPDPNWTPLPISAQEAVTEAAKFAAGSAGTQPSGLEASLEYSSENVPLYVVKGPTVASVVTAYGGLVIEFVQIDALPDSNDVVASSDAARAAATSFLSDHGRDTGILIVTTALRSAGAASAYVVSWAAQGAAAADISVSVSPSSGEAFAFVDERSGVQLVPPAVGAAAAGRQALGAVSVPGALVVSAEFRFDLAHPSWDVSLASPGTSPDATPEHGALVSVDAVTGAATVDKSY